MMLDRRAHGIHCCAHCLSSRMWYYASQLTRTPTWEQCGLTELSVELSPAGVFHPTLSSAHHLFDPPA